MIFFRIIKICLVPPSQSCFNGWFFQWGFWLQKTRKNLLLPKVPHFSCFNSLESRSASSQIGANGCWKNPRNENSFFGGLRKAKQVDDFNKYVTQNRIEINTFQK